MQNSRKILVLAGILSSLALAVGCSREPSGTSSSSSPAASAAASGVAHAPVVSIECGDAMKFSVTRIEAAPGAEITLTLKNTGKMPKAAMGHNWVLLNRGVDARGFSMAAMAATPDSNYLPAARMTEVLAHTKLLGPGESDTITFTAPSEPGVYPFLCSFPGHFLSGMGGELVVK